MEMNEALALIATTDRRFVVEVTTATGTYSIPVRRSDLLSTLATATDSTRCDLQFIDRPHNVLAVTGGDPF